MTSKKVLSARALREYCKDLQTQREEEVKQILSNYFEYSFIKGHKPWKAVIGNKRCLPIPIYKDFYTSQDNEFTWPNLSEDLLRKTIENLGFVITKDKIRLSVPAWEKGKELTFAQEWVQKINLNYSHYCVDEKKKAEELYYKVISTLLSTDPNKIKTYEEYTIFEDVKFKENISRRCYLYLKSLLKANGIEEYYEGIICNKEYKGFKVLNKIIK